MRTPTRASLAAVLFALIIVVCAALPLAANSLQRDSDPVVLTGLDLPALVGADPGRIVAFRFHAGWVQIPVQVDERKVADFGAPYDTTSFGVTALLYADTSTFTGPDTDPAFDDDDELVFMARDAGDMWASPGESDPAGVLAGTRVDLAINNPLNGYTAFVYLFVTGGSLSPGAGADYVAYTFSLASGDYKATYSILTGPNPENSEVTTATYRTHFSDRWVRDEVNVKAGASTQADILDRHKNLFAPGNCGRSEDTFSAGEGCFVANIDGPVRAIRSYLGANSGPFTQRVHRFYERRHDVATHLRVHLISGVMDYYDYSPAASGMTYTNDLNTGGVTIDGAPDAVTLGPIVWEMVTGAQGTLVIADSLETDIPAFAYTSYYDDDSTSSVVTQCTGDAWEYGASGTRVNQTIPNTDPSLGPHNVFVARRSVYYEPPNQGTSLAQLRYAQATTPLVHWVPTSVAGDAPPPAIALFQNTPNPFGTQTAIGFRAPAGARVTIGVYDVAGRLVKTLRPVGSLDRAVWDGTDSRGRAVASGVYFCRLVVTGADAGRIARVRKMLLVR